MLLTQINADIIIAMKIKDNTKVNSLRYAKSLLLENDKSVKPREAMDILLSYKKTLEKSLETYASHPVELGRITYDIDLLGSYLPKQLNESEVIAIIKEIRDTKSLTDFNMLMKESMNALKGKVDGNKVAPLIKQMLSPSL